MKKVIGMDLGDKKNVIVGVRRKRVNEVVKTKITNTDSAVTEVLCQTPRRGGRDRGRDPFAVDIKTSDKHEPRGMRR